ncbi:hypothetical protein BU15DRAFT_76079 [Melanogaster broomeanus]|nr:hypothetical protein BU15DRAFT_76079 [Melanogaster broomeanus]
MSEGNDWERLFTSQTPTPKTKHLNLVSGSAEIHPGFAKEISTPARIHLKGAPDVGILQYFYVVIELDHQTYPQENLTYNWDDSDWRLARETDTCMDACNASTFTLRLYLRRRLHEPMLAGTISESLQSLLSSSGGISRRISCPPLLMSDGDGKAMTIHLDIKRLPLAGGIQVVDEFRSLANQPMVYDPGADMIKTMISHASTMFEFHPGAKMTFALLLTTYNIFLVDPDHSKSLRELVEAMSETYSIASEAKSSLEDHRSAFRQLARHTTECNYFVREYIAKKGILHSLIYRPTIENAEKELKGYINKFQELKHYFQQYVGVPHQTRSNSTQGGDVNATRPDAVHRSDSDHRAYNEHSDELHSGALQTIDDIVAWARGEGHERVCLLTGDKDSEMSDAAWHIACKFKALSGLCSMYSFRQNDPHLGDQPILQHPRDLFQVIATDLAGKHQPFQQSLASSGGTVTVTCGADSTPRNGCEVVSAQFQELILAAARRVEDLTPVFIIIDALDECLLEDARRSISTTLAEKAANLPANFHILITVEKDMTPPALKS